MQGVRLKGFRLKVTRPKFLKYRTPNSDLQSEPLQPINLHRHFFCGGGFRFGLSGLVG